MTLFGPSKAILNWLTKKSRGPLLSAFGQQLVHCDTNQRAQLLLERNQGCNRTSYFGELYEEYFPIESELTAVSEDFRTLFFQVLGLYEYLKEGRGSPKTYEWHRKWNLGIEGKSDFFKGKGFYRKVQKEWTTPNY